PDARRGPPRFPAGVGGRVRGLRRAGPDLPPRRRHPRRRLPRRPARRRDRLLPLRPQDRRARAPRPQWTPGSAAVLLVRALGGLRARPGPRSARVRGRQPRRLVIRSPSPGVSPVLLPVASWTFGED